MCFRYFNLPQPTEWRERETNLEYLSLQPHIILKFRNKREHKLSCDLF
jgi:hypothetical protein